VNAPADPRRHDLDALRAVAMLLGIVLHATLAYVPGVPWPVQDTQKDPLLGILFWVIHGFRMPLFFLISGFFTAMLFSKRGMVTMLAQRYKRVFVPFILALTTIVPFFEWESRELGERAAAQDAARPDAGSTPALFAAIRANDAARIEALLAEGEDANATDPEFRQPPLTLAALLGRTEIARLLIDAGADVNQTDGGGYTALHSAAFLGQLPVAELLLARGADPGFLGPMGDAPANSTKADRATTDAIRGMLRVPSRDWDNLVSDRASIHALLVARTGASQVAAPPGPAAAPAGSITALLDGWRQSYRGWFASDRFVVPWPPKGEPLHLFLGMVFDYLWFLWFLCWLVLGFAAVAGLATLLRIPRLPRWVVVSRLSLLWLVPLTLLPQAFMGQFGPVTGPDTSLGILPQPHVLAYYAIFFGYGALLYLADDADGRVGKRWWALIPLALLICVPWSLATMNDPLATALPQALFAWLMSLGCIGLFRAFLPAENRTVRYLSDSAYWLYLAHMPVLIGLQFVSRQWAWSAALKCLVVCTVATALLLLSYQLLVRHTWLGVLLNGPRRERQPGDSRAAIRSAS
jgi:hypothetical protein